MEQQAPVLDARQLEKLAVLQDEDTPNLVAEMAQGYLTRTPARLARLRELCAAGNAPAFANEVHGLATASGMFGMMRMRQHCKALENLARDSDGLEGAQALLERIEHAFAEARPLLLAELKLTE